MTGETEKEVSGWTVDTLRIHHEKQHIAFEKMLQERYDSQTRSVQAALDSAEKAVEKAEKATEKRFEATNEFRAQLADQAERFMPRKEADVRNDAVQDKVTTIDNRVANIQGRMIAYAGIGAMAGGILGAAAMKILS